MHKLITRKHISRRGWKMLSGVALSALVFTLSLGCLRAATNSAPATSAQNAPGDGVVYTASNASAGNEVFAYKRQRDGGLIFQSAFPTGGLGNDAGLGTLGNQGGVTLSQNGNWLLVVNPGSNDVSVFRVKPNGALVLTETEPSNGILPTSVTIEGNLVYVLNSAEAGSIAGFTMDNKGQLAPIAGSIQPLSGANPTAAAQIQFTPNGQALVVTEKATSLIDTYLLDNHGVAGAPIVQAAPGETPFGFGFSRDSYLIVSDAFAGVPNGGELASFTVQPDGELQVITPGASTHQTAPCWIVITNSGKFTYTTNTASGNVSGFRINRFTGQLTPLDADGITADTGGPGSVPIDEALSRDSSYLYVLNSGFQQILGYRINPFNGSLEKIAELDSVPPFAFGLAAR